MADVTLEEMEADFAENPEETPKVEAPKEETAPSQYGGKSMHEVVAALEATTKALQISEEARLRGGQQPKREEPQGPPPLTEDQLNELMQTNPLEAVRYITEQARREAESHIERRLGSLQSGALSNAEAQARQTYSVEFELFGDEIKQFVDSLPDKSALNQPGGWEDVVAYVRGRKGNIDKYIQRVVAQPNKDTARAEQAQLTGATFTGRTAVTSPSNSGGGGASQLDDVQRQIAQEFVNSGVFKTIDEYAKFTNNTR